MEKTATMTSSAKILVALAILVGLICVIRYGRRRNQTAEISRELYSARNLATELDQNHRMAIAKEERLRRDLGLLAVELAAEKMSP